MQIYEDPPTGLYNTDATLWFNSFRHFIFTNIVPRVLPDNTNPYRNDYAKILISDEAMKIWVVAFTDPTFDRNIDSNYELLELLGDRVLSAIFSNFIISRYPGITEETLTKINSTYMSKVKQKEKAKYLRLHKWVRTSIDITIHTSEDVFESTFGALYKIGDNFIGKGNGYALCTNFITELYHDLQINLDLIMADPITQVKEIFEKLNWRTNPDDKFNPSELGNIKENKDPIQGNKWILTLKLTHTAIEFLKLEGLWDNTGPILSNQTGKDKKTLTNSAFKEALDNLNSRFKINYKWAGDFSRDKFVREFEYIAKNRMSQDGIIELWFPKSKKTSDKQFLQLVGINIEDKNIILLTVQSNFDTPLSNLKIFSVRYYAANGKINDIIMYDENF